MCLRLYSKLHSERKEIGGLLRRFDTGVLITACILRKMFSSTHFADEC